MARFLKNFKNIGQMKLSARNLFFVVIALFGAVISFSAHQWLEKATNQEVTMASNPPSDTIINSEGNPGIPPRLNVDVVLVVDWSGSMNGSSGSDPQGLRLRASEVMASSLAADIFPRHTRMGYVQFAKTAVVVQDLIDVEDKDARIGMIQKVYGLSSEVAKNSDWSTLTNISDALSTAGRLLDEAKSKNDPKFESNIPAIVFLTDGRPTNGFTSEEKVHEVVDNFLENGTLIFVVILRNPNIPEPDLVIGLNDSPLNFSFWRSFWHQISSDHPDQVKYFEAQDDTQLEGIYNIIRSRLVREGTAPSDRLEYNPSDPNAYIDIPPGLLQAHLLVNHPIGVDSIGLIAPDGLNFEQDILKDPEKNEILDGNLFYRFSMYKPIPGKWTLTTDARQPLYYLLITESIYTAKPFVPNSAPYLDPDRPTELPFVVVDDLDNIVNDVVFDLKASTLRTVQKENGSFVEEGVVLSSLTPIRINDETRYVLTLNPDMFKGLKNLQVQIDGASDAGAPINLASYEIPVLPAPSGFEIIAPTSIICDAAKLVFWPPAIQCGNQVKIEVNVENAELLSEGTLNGITYTPIEKKGIEMTSPSPSSLQASLPPLTQVGEYQVVVDVGGEVDAQDGDFRWQKRGEATIEVAWPTWVEPAKHRTWFAFILLLILGIWKPILVSLLLPFFAVLRIAPSGFFTDGDGQPIRVYELAMKKRSLLTLTIGSSHNSDIKVYPPSDDTDENNFSSKFPGRLLRNIYRWLKSLPCARLVAMPWNGVWVEKPPGKFEKASELKFTKINCQNVNVRVGQRDWEDEDDHR